MNANWTIWLAGLVLWAAASIGAQGAEASRYWQLGWGLYGGEGLDAARFDWHMICFGNVGANQATVDALNETLRINPKHKFLIRVWPIMGQGDCPENRHQATLFHYFYKPGVREKVLEETKRQIELVCQGVNRPQNVYGSCFLEELPGHFTSVPFGGRWKPGDELPWDIKRFQKEIEAELGEPLDWSSQKHRLWWGRKYCQALGEIHRAMKEASGGKPVFYYQATAWNTLDHLELPIFKDRPPVSVVPIRYADILKPGLCDGIFGYPNNQTVWENQTQSVVGKHRCLLFSQMSLPPGMRLCKFDEMVALARWENPGNVGAFLYGTHGRKERAHNALEYQDDSSYWTLSDHVRRFAWERQIGLSVVNQTLAPKLAFVYDLSKAGPGQFVPMLVQVTNPRDPSWYGGSVDEATLHQPTITLKLPEGFRILPSHSAPATVKLDDLGPRATQLVKWWVLVDSPNATIPSGQAFSATLTAAGAPRVAVSSSDPTQTIPSFQKRMVVRSGERWTEPLYDQPRLSAVAELTALAEVLCPELGSQTRTATYRDVLHPGERLVIGPGLHARLCAPELFSQSERRFGAEPDGAVFDRGLVVHQTRPVPVRSGQRFQVTVMGWAKEGGNCQVLARFAWRESQGKRRAEAKTQDVSCLSKGFGPKAATVSAEIRVPDVPGDDATLRLLFYRLQAKGTVCYQSFDCRRLDVPADGRDVTGKLVGVLPALESPLSDWLYRDLSDPNPYDRPKLELRFLSPEEIERAKTK